MKLRAHLAERGRTTELAKRLNLAPAYVHQMASGKRPVPVGLAHAVVEQTGGAVRLWDLRPDDWFRVWPELIGTKGAPAVKAKA